MQGGIPADLPVIATIAENSANFAGDVEKAIASADAKGGVIQIPAGVFSLKRPLIIRRDGIVLRGKGPQASGGTTIRELGVPLHCHYSGNLGRSGREKASRMSRRPRRAEAGQGRRRANVGGTKSEWLCPRSGYLRELMIPQMMELIDRYGVDGLWIDGDLWGGGPVLLRALRDRFPRKDRRRRAVGRGRR